MVIRIDEMIPVRDEGFVLSRRTPIDSPCSRTYALSPERCTLSAVPATIPAYRSRHAETSPPPSQRLPARRRSRCRHVRLQFSQPIYWSYPRRIVLCTCTRVHFFITILLLHLRVFERLTSLQLQYIVSSMYVMFYLRCNGLDLKFFLGPGLDCSFYPHYVCNKSTHRP